MANPHTVKPNDGNGCIVHAGILTPHGGDVSKAQLTSGYPEAAKERFIAEVVERLTFSVPVPFPCGAEITPLNPDQSALFQDLANEEKYPDFHKNVLGHYLEMARSLDAQSELNLLPICDPIALGYKLGVDIEIPDLPGFMQFAIPNIPGLAVKLDMTPPELALKIHSLIPPLPSIPKFSFDLPIPPSMYLDLYEFRGIPPIELKFPEFMLDLSAKIPDFMIKLITLDLPEFLGEICKLVKETFFPKQKNADNGALQDVVRVVCVDVLARKFMEMLIMHAMAKTIGTTPSGLVGFFGTYRGYSPPKSAKKEAKSKEDEVRDIIVSTAFYAEGMAWSYDNKDNRDNRPYTSFISPRESTSTDIYIKEGAYKFASEASSCGLVARSCLAAAGASFVFDLRQRFDRSVIFGLSNSPSVYTSKSGKSKLTLDYFNDFYRGGAVSALCHIAFQKKAIIPPSSMTKNFAFWVDGPISKLPNMKRGDIIVIGDVGKNNDHVMVLVEDYNEGDDKMTVVHGGQIDQGNKGKASYIPKVVKKAFVPTVLKVEDPDKGITSGLAVVESNAATQALIQQAAAEAAAASAAADAAAAAESNKSATPSGYDANAGYTPSAQEGNQQPVQEAPPPENPVLGTEKAEVTDEGYRCTGIQRGIFYTPKKAQELGIIIPKPGGANLHPGPGYSLITMKEGMVEKGKKSFPTVALGGRAVKLLIDGAILVLGKKTDEIDTTQVGKDFVNPSEMISPEAFKQMVADANHEQSAADPPITTEMIEKEAKAVEGEYNKKKKEKEEAVEKKKKEGEEKRAAKLKEWKGG